MGQEFLYDHNSVAIAVMLFLAIVLFNELGFRLGRFVQRQTDDEVKTLTGSIQGSILGLLALLLGFTFSMAMQRFDNRSMALIDEANAIGTAVLRMELLPQQFQDEARSAFREYVALRIKIGGIDLTRKEDRRAHQERVAELQNQLWSLAVKATSEDPRPVTTGAFVSALNAVIDSQGKRTALLQMHVPEVVILLLFLVFTASGAMLGYSGGLSGRRVFIPVVLISLLITLIVFIILDLDRPKRGLIQVDQSPMIDLKVALGKPDPLQSLSPLAKAPERLALC